jgi:hypothetical protein
MSNKLIIALICLLASCQSDTKQIKVKTYATDKPCICNFYYTSKFGSIFFQDSCDKYNIGDTIK